MIKLEKLYSIPEIFDPIHFDSGLNLIVGEVSEGSNKTNGVGKSVCIEFLNFCLLKKASDSRVTLIPKNTIVDKETVIKLNFRINEISLTVSRKVLAPDNVSILKDSESVDFSSTDDASDYLGNLYFEQFPTYEDRISFRNLLAPVIRDERSEFKDIIKCFDTDKTIPRDFKPHLFFLGFGLELYGDISRIVEALARKTKYLTETTKLLTNDNEIKVSDAKAKLNELESEVKKINASIEQLRNNDSFELVQNELIILDAQLKEIREQQKGIKYQIKQIEVLPQPEEISDREIALLFNQFKEGLGDMIQKSLDDVKLFQNKIDNFRNTIVNSNLVKLKEQLKKLNETARKLDDSYSEKVQILDNGELLGNLKSAIRIFNEKNRELSTLRTLIDQYNQADREKKALVNEKNIKISEFDLKINQLQAQLDSFENTILDIHEAIFGNRQAHFEIRTINKSQAKEFLVFDLRTDDDHSWSTERMKVFIYDMALMFNEYTKVRHPKFLVHDNIFNVDNDTLQRSLNFVYHQEQLREGEFQYILTINRDMIESMEQQQLLQFDIETHTKAVFTKENRFLKTKYSEINKRR